MTEIVSLPWKPHRRKSLGASALAAVIGLNPYKTPYDVWNEYANGVDAEATPAMLAGIDAEPIILKRANRSGQIPVKLVSAKQRLMRRADLTWLHATPDAISAPDATLALGEMKFTQHFNKRLWQQDTFDGDPRTTGYPAPDHYVVQAEFQAWLLERPYTYLVGDTLSEQFVVRIERPLDTDVKHALERAEAFWFDHVLKKTPPPDDWTPTALRPDYANARYRVVTIDEYAIVTGEQAAWARTLLATLDELTHTINAATDRKTAIVADLKLLIGEYKGIVIEGQSEPAVTWHAKKSTPPYAKILGELAKRYAIPPNEIDAIKTALTGTTRAFLRKGDTE